MDSRTHLDRALFQLTPTRTRFDLVLFYKGKNEKLASGLFEPFISHLKVARDELAVGGYSISLQPPVPNAPWFTKATLERFVRFVSTPAVLERFVSLEREILQIEKSIPANEVSKTNLVGGQEEDHGSVANGHRRKPSDSSKVKSELDRKYGTLPEENSKIQLHCLLGTRKILLRKEQAMAYARGLVAGFATENMVDLISFAEAFGASRLREACANFIEVCKKKHADHLWMEELAAVKTCSLAELSLSGTSGIVLTKETSNPNPLSNESLDASKSLLIKQTATTDSKKDYQTPSTATKYQMPMQWPNQMPQYMYNFPGLAQQLPSYQGYPFASMQPVPLHHQGNTHQPLNKNQKSSSRKKERLLNGKEDEYSGEDGQTKSSASDSGSDTRTARRDRNHLSPDHSSRREHRKKSSRTIVIRNINYITPKRRDGKKRQVSDGSSFDEDDFDGKDFSREKKIEDAANLLEECCKLNSGDEKHRVADRGHYSTNRSDDVSQQNISDDLEVVISKGGSIGDNWEVFQKVLTTNGNASVKEVETNASTPSIELDSEKVLKQQMVSVDSFIVKERDGKSESRVKSDDFVNEESFHLLMKSGNCTDEVLFNPRRLEKSGNEPGDILSTSVKESSIIKSGKGDDWFVVNHSGKPEQQHSTNGRIIFDGEQVLPFRGNNSYHQMSKKYIFIDDPFMVQARPEVDSQYDSQWKTEISMIADLTSASKPENGTADVSQDKNNVLGFHEPDDLYMVLGQEARFESARDSMTLDYGVDLSLIEANGRCSDSDGKEYAEKKLPSDVQKTIVRNNDNCRRKMPVKEARSKMSHGSLVKSRAETMSKSQKLSSLVNRARVQKSKLEKEEEMRKKMEELLIQRQKRIAERTAAGGYASAVSKKAISESKATKNLIKPDKNKNLSTAQATDRVSTVKLRST